MCVINFLCVVIIKGGGLQIGTVVKHFREGGGFVVLFIRFVCGVIIGRNSVSLLQLFDGGIEETGYF